MPPARRLSVMWLCAVARRRKVRSYWRVPGQYGYVHVGGGVALVFGARSWGFGIVLALMLDAWAARLRAPSSAAILAAACWRSDSSLMTGARFARMFGRGKLGLGTPYGIERLCGRSHEGLLAHSQVSGAAQKKKASPGELALFSSVSSPSFPLWLRPKAALGGALWRRTGPRRAPSRGTPPSWRQARGHPCPRWPAAGLT